MMNLEWKKIHEDEPIKVGWRKICKKTFEMPDGAIEDYFIKKEGCSASVLALTDDQKVILSKQYRPGPEKVLMDLPGGYVNENEDPIKAISRELLEETGYSGDIELVSKAYRCAYSDAMMYCFVAKNCKKIAEPTMDKTEFIEVILMDLDDFKKHLHSGQQTDPVTGFMGLNYLGLS